VFKRCLLWGEPGKDLAEDLMQWAQAA